MLGKVSALSNDVEQLTEKDRIREEGALEEPRSRSRSPHRDERDRPRSMKALVTLAQNLKEGAQSPGGEATLSQRGTGLTWTRTGRQYTP